MLVFCCVYAYHDNDYSFTAVFTLFWILQVEDDVVALLEVAGSKGWIVVNGLALKKNATRVLKSGDEIVFGVLGNHAYVSFCSLYHTIITNSPPRFVLSIRFDFLFYIHVSSGISLMNFDVDFSASDIR